jgi:hypothetical protein
LTCSQARGYRVMDTDTDTDTDSRHISTDSRTLCVGAVIEDTKGVHLVSRAVDFGLANFPYLFQKSAEYLAKIASSIGS